MSHHITIRVAEAADVDTIHQLLLPLAEVQRILPRPRDDIFEHLQEFVVALYDEKLAGVAAMHVYGSNLAEVRSLVVDEAYHGLGIGRLLVEACERWGAGLGLACIFALTYVPDFFTRMGYERVLKESLPHKIWTVCIHCEKFSQCDETAVQKRLTDAPIEPMTAIPIIEVDKA